MIDKETLREEFLDKHHEKYVKRHGKTPPLSDVLSIHIAWETAWNLATEQARVVELTLQEAYPKNYKDNKS